MNAKKILVFSLSCLLAFGCYAKKTNESEYVVEESGLNVTKITDESLNSVIGPKSNKGVIARATGGLLGGVGNLTRGVSGSFAKEFTSGSKKAGCTWSPIRTLAMSPDGSELGYITRKNKQDNVMIRKSTGASASTQRTFRNVNDFCWGPDENLYISDFVDAETSSIGMVDAHKGSTMRQITSSNIDRNPATIDGKKIFFTRMEANGPMIWCFNSENGELVSCARGYQCTPVSEDEFYCVRNTTDGTSEIWKVNFVNGQETLIVSNKEQGYSNPSISPDGQWILLQGNAKSSSSKKQNLDIFVVRPDGSQLTQLTYHPSDDMCPIWSADGKNIYFISSRGSKNGAYNVWRMNFNL